MLKKSTKTSKDRQKINNKAKTYPQVLHKMWITKKPQTKMLQKCGKYKHLIKERTFT